jgi:hypothetical protein
LDEPRLPWDEGGRVAGRMHINSQVSDPHDIAVFAALRGARAAGRGDSAAPGSGFVGTTRLL